MIVISAIVRRDIDVPRPVEMVELRGPEISQRNVPVLLRAPQRRRGAVFNRVEILTHPQPDISSGSMGVVNVAAMRRNPRIRPIRMNEKSLCVLVS
jgi:hypothetical protein